MSKRPGVSIRDYVEHRRQRQLVGATKNAVQKALRSGRIQYIDGKPKNGIDPAAADAAWAANTDPDQRARAAQVPNGAEPKAPPRAIERNEANLARAQRDAPGNGEGDQGGALDYYKSRAIREAYTAKMAQLDYQERMRQVIPTDVAARLYRAVTSNVREKMLALEDALDRRLARCTEKADRRAAIRDECYAVLQALAEDPVGVLQLAGGQDDRARG